MILVLLFRIQLPHLDNLTKCVDRNKNSRPQSFIRSYMRSVARILSGDYEDESQHSQSGSSSSDTDDDDDDDGNAGGQAVYNGQCDVQ